MKRVGAVASLLVVGAVACLHTPADRTEAALEADRERAAAFIAADEQRLEAILHASLTYTHANGVVDTRDSMLSKLVSGRVRYRVIHLDQPEARIHGDTAVVTGGAWMVLLAGEQRLRLRSVYTAVYWWEDGRWQLAAYQSGPAAP